MNKQITQIKIKTFKGQKNKIYSFTSKYMLRINQKQNDQFRTTSKTHKFTLQGRTLKFDSIPETIQNCRLA